MNVHEAMNAQDVRPGQVLHLSADLYDIAAGYYVVGDVSQGGAEAVSGESSQTVTLHPARQGGQGSAHIREVPPLVLPLAQVMALFEAAPPRRQDQEEGPQEAPRPPAEGRERRMNDTVTAADIGTDVRARLFARVIAPARAYIATLKTPMEKEYAHALVRYLTGDLAGRQGALEEPDCAPYGLTHGAATAAPIRARLSLLLRQARSERRFGRPIEIEVEVEGP